MMPSRIVEPWAVFLFGIFGLFLPYLARKLFSKIPPD